MITIAKHQISSGLKDTIYLIILVIILLAFIINAFSFSKQYEQNIEDFNISKIHVTDTLNNAKNNLMGLASTDQELVKPPLAFAFISNAGMNNLPNTLSVNAFTIDNLRCLNRGNNMHPNLVSLDWTFIIGSLMSLMTILVSFRSICGEKSDGTLRLLLSNPVSRLKLFVGKYLGLLMVITLALATGIVINISVISYLGSIPLSADLYLVVINAFLLSILYLSLFLLVCLAVSSMTRQPAISLVILLVLWVIIVVASPGLAKLTAEQTYQFRSSEEVQQEIDAMKQDLKDKALLPSTNVTQRGQYNIEQRCAFLEQLYTAEENIKRSAMTDKIRQANSVYFYSGFSPFGLFSNSLENLCNSGIHGFIEFYNIARRYREILNSYIVERDSTDSESPHYVVYSQYYKPGIFSVNPVELSTIPRWESLWTEYGSPRAQSWPLLIIVILIAENLLVSLIAFLALMRYDPR